LIARRIQQRLTGPASGEAITLESVRVNYFGKEDWQWGLTAQIALVPPNSRIVQLEGDVELRPLEGDNTAFLRTDELAIDTEKHLAYSTRSPAHMRFGQHSMTVKTLRADLTSEKLRLETVNGRFEPQTRR
jgi:LPS export ABC transporter protein LptC